MEITMNVDLDEVINNVSEEDLEDFEEMYSKSDRFSNFLERKKYLERNYPEISKKYFYYTPNAMFRVVASIGEFNANNKALHKPHHIIYTIGLDYGYKHPELIVLNGVEREEDRSAFEKNFDEILYQLGHYTKYGLLIEPGIDYADKIEDCEVPVPLIFERCTPKLLETIKQTFRFEITNFYKYFTFDENKTPRPYQMPMVLDLTNIKRG
jgi:hypothetical protein